MNLNFVNIVIAALWAGSVLGMWFVAQQPWPLFLAATLLVIQLSLLLPPLQKSPRHALSGVAEVTKFSLLLLAPMLPSCTAWARVVSTSGPKLHSNLKHNG